MGQLTLQDGSMRGDLIEPYKILCRTDKADGENTWCRFRIRLYCFQNADVEEFLLSQRAVYFLKYLPQRAVEVKLLNIFKAKINRNLNWRGFKEKPRKWC